MSTIVRKSMSGDVEHSSLFSFDEAFFFWSVYTFLYKLANQIYFLISYPVFVWYMTATRVCFIFSLIHSLTLTLRQFSLNRSQFPGKWLYVECWFIIFCYQPWLWVTSFQKPIHNITSTDDLAVFENVSFPYKFQPGLPILTDDEWFAFSTNQTPGMQDTFHETSHQNNETQGLK